MSSDDPLPNGPIPGTTYPIKMTYCGNCNMPLEYCDFWPEYEKCKLWLEKNLPNEFERIMNIKDTDEDGANINEEEKKRQKRGGKGQMKAKKKQDKPAGIKMYLAPRGKKKYVTVITGLSTYDISLKVASKYFASKFSCGSSVTGDDEIVIQGDFKDELEDIIISKWPQVDTDTIEDMGEMKRAT